MKTKITKAQEEKIMLLLSEGKNGADIYRLLVEQDGLKCSQKIVYDRINKLTKERKAITHAAIAEAAGKNATDEIQRSKAAIDLLWNQANKSLSKNKINEARLCIETMMRMQEKLGYFANLNVNNDPFEDAKEEFLSEMNKLRGEKDK